MAETRAVRQIAYFEDKRMWRLLLARLHPDAGGDHELFTFACAVKEELLGQDLPEDHPDRSADADHEKQSRAEHFLRTWQDAMGRWSSNNHDALRDLRAR